MVIGECVDNIVVHICTLCDAVVIVLLLRLQRSYERKPRSQIHVLVVRCGPYIRFSSWNRDFWCIYLALARFKELKH